MMKHLKKTLTRPVCLILSLVILAASMTVAALTGSPYDTLKDAAFNMMKIDNATLSADVTLSVDGEVHEQESGTIAFSDGACLTTSTDGNFSYQSAKYNLYTNGGPLQYRLHVNQEGQYSRSHNPLAELNQYSRSDMYVRLGELCVDLLMGDLKNNIAISNNGDSKTLAMTLTAQQIPEIYNALLAVAVAESSGNGRHGEYRTELGEYHDMQIDTKAMTKTIIVYPCEKQYYEPGTGSEIEEDDPRANEDHYYHNIDWGNPITSKTKTTPLTAADFGGQDKMDQPFKDAVIDYAGFTMRLDKNDILMDGRGDLRVNLTTIFGETVVIEATVNLTCENVGTTDPQMPVPGVEEIFTDEFVQAFIDAEMAALTDEKAEDYYKYVSPSFIFSLNADGTIDRDSIKCNGYNGVPRTVAYDENGNAVAFPSSMPTDSEVRAELLEIPANEEISSIAIIGGADGPTEIFVN